MCLLYDLQGARVHLSAALQTSSYLPGEEGEVCLLYDLQGARVQMSAAFQALSYLPGEEGGMCLLVYLRFARVCHQFLRQQSAPNASVNIM